MLDVLIFTDGTSDAGFTVDLKLEIRFGATDAATRWSSGRSRRRMDGRPLEGETAPQPDGSDGHPGNDRRMWGKCPENLHLFFFWSRKDLSASDLLERLCERKKTKNKLFVFCVYFLINKCIYTGKKIRLNLINYFITHLILYILLPIVN